MKTLIIVRHAKSTWDEPGISDIERKLNKRGERDAPHMGKVLFDLGIRPDLMITSPATRAYTTSKFFAQSLEFPVEEIVVNETIYERGPQQILYMVNEFDDAINTAILFGHNPDLSFLVKYLSDFEGGNLPTCGTVCIDFNVNNWTNVGEEKGKMRFFEYPKKYFKRD
jgi:phosphohistidine phosphatase